MKTYIILLGFLIICIQNMSCQDFICIKLGTSDIKLESIGNKSDTLVFINLHQDEQTSITAIKKILPKSNGRFLGIQSGNKREISVKENGQSITFDPNRIFTKVGIEKTLTNYHCLLGDNVRLVDAFARELLGYLTKAKLLVAIHNNSDAGFSIKSISKTNPSKHDAVEIYINPGKDEDDFYFVTKKTKFDYFKSKGYNVILQDNLNAEDDGSLSVYCGKANIDYINVECQSGHLKEQIQMIKEIYKQLLLE